MLRNVKNNNDDDNNNNINNNNEIIAPIITYKEITIIVLIFRIEMGFAEDHGSLVIKSHISSNHIEVAY